MTAQLLSDSYLLRGAADQDIDQINQICELREFQGGESIVSAHTRDQDIMIVVEGRVQVETMNGDLISELRTGAMIGEIAFLDSKERTANIMASGACKIAVIPAAKLRELMSQNLGLANVILQNASLALCQRLREANQQIESMLNPRS